MQASGYAGIGLVTPLGIGAHANWISLVQGLSGVTALLPEYLPAEQHLANELPSRVIGAVDNEALNAAISQVYLESQRCHVEILLLLRHIVAADDISSVVGTCSSR